MPAAVFVGRQPSLCSTQIEFLLQFTTSSLLFYTFSLLSVTPGAVLFGPTMRVTWHKEVGGRRGTRTGTTASSCSPGPKEFFSDADGGIRDGISPVRLVHGARLQYERSSAAGQLVRLEQQ